MNKSLAFILAILAATSLVAEPQKVKLDVYVVNLGKLDLVAGKFSANLEITAVLPPGMREMPRLDFLNGAFEPGKFEETSGAEDLAQGTHTFKATADIEFDPDFTAFPWDHQDLSIEIVATRPVDQIVFEAIAGEERVAERAQFAGWKLTHEPPTIHETTLGEKEKFSVYEFPLTISRNPLSSFMKVFFTLAIMVFISLLAVFVGPGSIPNRLTMVTGTLLGAVMFHLNATSSLPQIGYLTLADKVFMATYISFLLSVGLTMIMWKKNDAKQEEEVKKLYKIGTWAIPAVSAFMYLLVFLRIV